MLAERKFREALAVCAVYNFQEELNEVYFSLAQLHLQFQRYDTAFEFCSEALLNHPTAKVWSY